MPKQQKKTFSWNGHAKQQQQENEENIQIDYHSKIICKQIERFYRIIRKEFVENIFNLHRLRISFRERFYRDGYFRLPNEDIRINDSELERNFPILNSKQEIRDYQEQFYCLGNTQTMAGLLFPNGLIGSNENLNNLIDMINEQYELFYHLQSDCILTLELLMAAHENCNVFDERFLSEIINEFRKYSQHIVRKHEYFYRLINEDRAKDILMVATYPQYEDLRFLCCYHEQVASGRILMKTLDNLYYGYLFLLDLLIKNGSQLAEHLRLTYRNAKKQQQNRKKL